MREESQAEKVELVALKEDLNHLHFDLRLYFLTD